MLCSVFVKVPIGRYKENQLKIYQGVDVRFLQPEQKISLVLRPWSWSIQKASSKYLQPYTILQWYYRNNFTQYLKLFKASSRWVNLNKENEEKRVRWSSDNELYRTTNGQLLGYVTTMGDTFTLFLNLETKRVKQWNPSFQTVRNNVGAGIKVWNSKFCIITINSHLGTFL